MRKTASHYLLRQTIRGILNESDTKKFNYVELTALATSKDLAPKKQFLGFVFYPAGRWGGFPFLVAARDAASDAEASAYLLMFDRDDPDLDQIEAYISVPPIIEDVTSSKLQEILTSWRIASVPSLPGKPGVHSEQVKVALQNSLDKLKIIRQRKPVELGMRPDAYTMSTGTGDLLKGVHSTAKVVNQFPGMKMPGSVVTLLEPGGQKIWRYFGPAAQHSITDAVITALAMASDTIGSLADAAPYISSRVRHPLIVGALAAIEASDQWWNIASIAAAGTTMTDSALDFYRLKQTRALDLRPAALDRKINAYKHKVIGDVAGFCISIAIAGFELMTSNNPLSGTAELVFKGLKWAVYGYFTLYKGFIEDEEIPQLEAYYNNTLLPKLREHRNDLLPILALISKDYPQYDSSPGVKLAIDETKKLLETA